MSIWGIVGFVFVMGIWLILARVDQWIKPDFWSSCWREVLGVVDAARPFSIKSIVTLTLDLLFYGLGLAGILLPVFLILYVIYELFN